MKSTSTAVVRCLMLSAGQAALATGQKETDMAFYFHSHEARQPRCPTWQTREYRVTAV